jgi:hypothetical protein
LRILLQNVAWCPQQPIHKYLSSSLPFINWNRNSSELHTVVLTGKHSVRLVTTLQDARIRTNLSTRHLTRPPSTKWTITIQVIKQRHRCRSERIGTFTNTLQRYTNSVNLHESQNLFKKSRIACTTKHKHTGQKIKHLQTMSKLKYSHTVKCW